MSIIVSVQTANIQVRYTTLERRKKLKEFAQGEKELSFRVFSFRRWRSISFFIKCLSENKIPTPTLNFESHLYQLNLKKRGGSPHNVSPMYIDNKLRKFPEHKSFLIIK